MSPLVSADLAGIAAVLAVGIFGGFFLLAVAIFIISVGNGRDPDPRGSRPMAAYYFSAAFLFLWVVYFGLVVALDSLVQLIGSHPMQVFEVAPSYTNAAIRDCALAVILLVIAGTGFVLHLQRGTALADTEEDLTGPTRRVMRSYVAFVSFLSIVVFVVAFVESLWQVLRFASPTIFGAGSTDDIARALLDSLILVVLSGIVFSYHQRFAPPSLRLVGTIGRPHPPAPGASAGAPTPTEVPPTPVP